MKFQKGNQFGLLRGDFTPNPQKLTEQELLEKIKAYIGWCADNPIAIEKVINQPSEIEHYDDKGNLERVEKLPYTRAIQYKPRPLLMTGLAAFIGFTEQGLHKYRKYGKDYETIMNTTSSLFKTQKLEGAMTGLYNGNLVALELGMRAKISVDKKAIAEMNDQERDQRIKQLLMKAKGLGVGKLQIEDAEIVDE